MRWKRRTTSSPGPRTPARSRSSSAAEAGQKTEVRTMDTAVKNVMTIRVVSVKRDTSFRELATALRENRVSAFPGLDDDGKVIRARSEADLLTKPALGGGYDGMPGMITGLLRRKEQGKARGVTAGDLMTGPAVTVVPEAAVEDAARLMDKHRVKRLPVIDADGHLAGII